MIMQTWSNVFLLVLSIFMLEHVEVSDGKHPPMI